MPRIAVLVLVSLLAVAGCGRKGTLEVPGPAVAPVAMQPSASMGNTVVSGPSEPETPRRRAARVERRTEDILAANADAPETGDAIPEGPTTGAVVPRRRFILDFLL